MSNSPTHAFAASKSSSALSSSSNPSEHASQPTHDRQTRGTFSAQSSLGDLPPLGGSSLGNNSGRSPLAPLKKTLPAYGKTEKVTGTMEKNTSGLQGKWGNVVHNVPGESLNRPFSSLYIFTFEFFL